MRITTTLFKTSLLLLLAATLAACSGKPAPLASEIDEGVLMVAIFGKNYRPASKDALTTWNNPDKHNKRGRYLLQAIAHTVLPDGVTVLVVNAQPAGADGQSTAIHDTPGLLNVFFMKQDGDQWQVLKRHEEGAIGNSGYVGDVKWIKLGADKPGMEIINSLVYYGNVSTSTVLYDLSDQKVRKVAGFAIHADNDVACDPEDHPDANKCWNVTGDYHFVAPQKPGPYDDVMMLISGKSELAQETDAAQQEQSAAAKEANAPEQEENAPEPSTKKAGRVVTKINQWARYAYDGKQYQLVEGENNIRHGF
ncbi:hypothetical protein [Janthinobacterium agaricidamnosum]|uniref:Putative lipoprotein n=1 Tax=Janthinobacterium agaricidamnosum NBRC 102515 = DSM 9628 TaxID=1349767 RepID=W0V233_9BURK|nr:hypothetical protein [Janthinobacterium agaricidamnosum]CDG81680.1 putative lipoprotein [Janthinobacterium agaricidamnosum NBRC 102515 = DSM 9628]